MKAFKYRLYPTKAQVSKMEWTLSRCCELYNSALQERKDAWNIWKRRELVCCSLLGLLHFATLSNGDTLENPRFFRRAEKKLVKKQQSLSRKKRGSNRRKKAAKLVGTCHRKIRNQRQDFLQKESRWLVDCYEMIAFEKLKPKNMSKAPKPKQDEQTGDYLPNGARKKAGLNKSILDAGWATFTQMVSVKAASAGHTTVVCGEPTEYEPDMQWLQTQRPTQRSQ